MAIQSLSQRALVPHVKAELEYRSALCERDCMAIMAGMVCLKTGNTLCKLNFKTHFGNPEIVFMNIHEHT